MSLVDAAKALATIEPIEDSDLGLRCMNCHASWRAIHPKHAPTCPWLSLPQIVAALEAAERVAQHGSEPHDCEYSMDENGHTPVMAFCGASTFGPHMADCPWQALRAALRGDGGRE